MAGAQKKTGVATYVPHRWLMLTAAGAATVGLACGIAKPAMAEWWKLTRFGRKAAVSKPAPVENGFAGTIRKLTAESRRAAEQGDHAKAVQLAERAAKISEAAAQVVGPQGDCSPQETARFLAQTRAQRNGMSIAAQAVPRPAPQQAPPSRKAVTFVPQQQIVATQPPIQPVQPPVANASKARRATPPSAKPEATTVASAPANNGPALFGGPSAAGNSKLQSRRSGTALPPSPSQPSRAEELLAQSRQEAAAGQYERALALADQAVAASPAASLFGAGTRSLESNEAVQWRKYLASQRQVMMAGVPAKKTLPGTRTQTPPAGEQSAAAKPQQKAESRFNQSTPVIVATNLPTTRDALWTEELPPAPSPRPRHQHEVNQFHRTNISRPGEWFDAATNEGTPSNNLRVSNRTDPAEPVEWSNEEPPAQEPMDPVPEFPIGDSTVTGIAASSVSDEKASMLFQTEIPATRPQIRLRGEIQQVAAEIPLGSSPARHRIKDVLARPERPQFDQIVEITPDSTNVAPKATSDDFNLTPKDNAVEVFPIDRVMELRERLQTVSNFDSGASKFNTPEPTAGEGEWQSSQQVSSAQEEAVSPSSTKRSALKLREPRAVLTDDPIEPVTKGSTPMVAPSARSEFVGHSEISRWKSAESTEASTEPSGAGLEQDSISQTAYEAPRADSALPESPSAETIPSAPRPPEWHDDGIVRKRASEVARKRSFSSADQTAHTTPSSTSTVGTLFGAGSCLLLGFGLASVRSALKKRHEA